VKEEYEVALKGPKTILLIIISILGLLGLVILGQLGNHMEVAVPIFFAVLLPFVVPYFLSTNYPKIAGWLLILEGTIPILYFLLNLFNPIQVYGDTIIFFFGKFFLLLIPVSLGIWMIIAIRKIQT